MSTRPHQHLQAIRKTLAAPPPTRDEVAERLGCHPETYRKWENGAKTDLDMAEIMALAVAWEPWMERRRDVLMPVFMESLVDADPTTLNALLIFWQLITGSFVEPD